MAEVVNIIPGSPIWPAGSEKMLIPLSQIKTLFGIEDNKDDQVLTLLGEGLTRRFELYTGQLLLHQDTKVTEQHDGGRCRLVLRHHPVLSIDEVTFSSKMPRDFDSNPDKVLQPKDYVLYGNRGIFQFLVQPPGAPLSVQVKYTTGNKNLDGMEDLERAFYAQLNHEYTQRNRLGVKSIGDAAGGRINQIGFDLLPEVKATLDSYKVLQLA